MGKVKEKNPKILIVDDEKIISDMLSDYFEMEGYEVMIASSGMEGLSRAREFKPDLITLDLDMDGMDGFDVLNNLKRYEATRDIPVLILSVDERKSSREKVLEMGAQDYLIKFLSLNMLTEKVKKYLRCNLLKLCFIK